MPFTVSIMLSTQNSGAVGTMPPTGTTSSVPISAISEFFSTSSCCIGVSPLFRRGSTQRRRSSDAGLVGSVDGLVAAHGAPDVVDHDQRAEEEQQPAHCADHVVGLHRLHGLD